jgi:hypothetical protein
LQLRLLLLRHLLLSNRLLRLAILGRGGLALVLNLWDLCDGVFIAWRRGRPVRIRTAQHIFSFSLIPMICIGTTFSRL